MLILLLVIDFPSRKRPLVSTSMCKIFLSGLLEEDLLRPVGYLRPISKSSLHRWTQRIVPFQPLESIWYIGRFNVKVVSSRQETSREQCSERWTDLWFYTLLTIQKSTGFVSMEGVYYVLWLLHGFYWFKCKICAEKDSIIWGNLFREHIMFTPRTEIQSMFQWSDWTMLLRNILILNIIISFLKRKGEKVLWWESGILSFKKTS